MTAPTTLPAEVQAIIARLFEESPSLLDGIPPAWINAAFDHGVIQASPWTGQGRTLYTLRPQPAVTP